MLCTDSTAGVLVIEANRFVADDLAEAVREHLSVEVHVLAAPDAAVTALGAGLAAAVAFVSAPLAAIESSGLDGAARAAGTKLVLVGGSLTREAAAGRGWLQMNSPFSAADVGATLAELCGSA